MELARDLSPAQCRALLVASSVRAVGHVAYGTPTGPGVVPVSYAVVDDAVVFRAAPFSELADHLWGARLAFTVDDLDPGTRRGWSLVARGRAEVVEADDDVQRLRRAWSPPPWRDGQRALLVRLPWSELSGRTSEASAGAAPPGRAPSAPSAASGCADGPRAAPSGA